MINRMPVQPRMVVMQLSTDEGAFICNVKESDLPKIDAGEAGTRIVIHCAIRLDAMAEGQYELHKTKVIDTSSIDFYQSLQRRALSIVPKGRPALVHDKGEKDE
ncbi:MAG TPA: hypothetical protein VMT71_16715 [Syntrophorhabdales bacterium]|nr:hypothetical protein [Syntrophorhabdales bacterium]